MKTILISFLIMGFIATGSFADCAYFRTESRLARCAEVDAETARAGDLYPSDSDVPELQEQASKILVQVDCECQYTLSGSDVRCDMDQAVDRRSVIDAENLSATCLRGRSLCNEVCPPRLP